LLFLFFSEPKQTRKGKKKQWTYRTLEEGLLTGFRFVLILMSTRVEGWERLSNGLDDVVVVCYFQKQTQRQNKSGLNF
jgi:hypothetical protein